MIESPCAHPSTFVTISIINMACALDVLLHEMFPKNRLPHILELSFLHISVNIG